MHQQTPVSFSSSAIFAASHVRPNCGNMESMARVAYLEAMDEHKPLNFSREQASAVVSSVTSGLERAASSASFAQLPLSKQHEAARMLASQFIQGQKLVMALQGALSNPATLATQLMNNAVQPTPISVFDRIVDLNRPRTPIKAKTVSFLGSVPVNAEQFIAMQKAA